jgi:hypothetical protein
MITSPIKSFGLFLIFALALLPVWIHVSDLYVLSLLYGVNGGLWLTNIHIYLSTSGPIAEGVFSPNVVAGISLFAVAPKRTLGWRMSRIFTVVFLVWLVRLWLLLIETHAALGGWHAAQTAEWLDLANMMLGPTVIALFWMYEQGLNAQRLQVEAVEVSAVESAEGAPAKKRKKSKRKVSPPRRRQMLAPRWGQVVLNLLYRSA